MLRQLFAAETGSGSPPQWALRRERWSALALDSSRAVVPHGDPNIAALHALDVDTQSGELLLAAGAARAAPGASEEHACVGVYRLCARADAAEATALAREQHVPRAHDQQPLAWAKWPEAGGAVVTARWMPRETSLFVTGNTDGVVSVWDAEVFEPVSSFGHGHEHGHSRTLSHGRVTEISEAPVPSVSSVHMSDAPGGHPELVAVTRREDHVKLLDLNSGAFTHTLHGHSEPVVDAQWSPTNPFLLATASLDRTARMFDVRRAGGAACLCIYDLCKTLAKARQQVPGLRLVPATTNCDERPLKRPRRPLLGLGMAWERADDSSAVAVRKRLARRAMLHGVGGTISSHRGGLFRVRFSPDGVHIVTGASDARIRVWDAFTGHSLLESFESCSSATARLFEISSDSSSLVSTVREGISTHVLAKGKLVSCLRGHFGTITALAVHPLREEVYSASREGEIFCWSPKSLDRRSNADG
jgi:WD domain, G-beta repeat